MSSKSTQFHDITYVGAHYSLCPVELRELWTKAFDHTHGRLLVAEIAKRHFAQHANPEDFGIVPIFTCNRFDICIAAQPTEAALLEFFQDLGKEALQLLQTHRAKPDADEHAKANAGTNANSPAESATELLQIITNPAKLKNVLRFQHGQDALVQLFKVACSLDSLVLGEPHILGQMKEQFLLARDLHISGKKIPNYFAKSFAIAKKVRTETGLGRNGVSIGHAAVLLVTRIFDDLGKRHALVIGAGEMGRLTAQHLLSQNIGRLTVANRTHAHAVQLVQDLGAGNALDLAVALNQLTSFDLIVVATAARETFINQSHFEGFDRRRKGRPAVIVDVSVPRNVDTDCATVSESLFVFDVDDLDKVMERNRKQRREAALAAERIIHEEFAQFAHAQIQRDNLLLVGQFHQLVRSLVLAELKKNNQKKHSRKQQGLSDEQRFSIVAQAVAKRLVSRPAELARQNTSLADDGLGTVGKALDALFDLKQAKQVDTGAQPDQSRPMRKTDLNSSKGT